MQENGKKDDGREQRHIKLEGGKGGGVLRCGVIGGMMRWGMVEGDARDDNGSAKIRTAK